MLEHAVGAGPSDADFFGLLDGAGGPDRRVVGAPALRAHRTRAALHTGGFLGVKSVVASHCLVGGVRLQPRHEGLSLEAAGAEF